MSTEIKHVSVIGAGRMGQPIIGHLARKGFTAIVYDVDAAKRAAVESRGGKWAADLAALATAEAMLICVGYDRELRELDRKSTRLNSSHCTVSRMPSSA